MRQFRLEDPTSNFTTVAKKRKAKAKVLARKRSSKRKMIATRRSTAGIGFDFEDYVAGWLLLQALAGRELPVQGQAQRLQMQTSSLGWDIDDVLLTTHDRAGDQRLAISCKGNVQVSANGLPLSFAKEAWRLWTKADSPFNRTADAMALATQGTHAGFQAGWGSSACHGTDRCQFPVQSRR
jgi:hypothetical protein